MDFNPLSSLTVEHDKLMHLQFFFCITAITNDPPVLLFRDQKEESKGEGT